MLAAPSWRCRSGPSTRRASRSSGGRFRTSTPFRCTGGSRRPGRICAPSSTVPAPTTHRRPPDRPPADRRGFGVGHDGRMRLDHLAYAAGPEGLAACVQRLGANLGAGFTDGGIHPAFGTRNFVLPLADGCYVEVVEALDHPAVDQAPFGRAVRDAHGRRAAAGSPGSSGSTTSPPWKPDSAVAQAPATGTAGRVRSAMGADRHQQRRERSAATLLHPLAERRRAPPLCAGQHHPAERHRDRRRREGGGRLSGHVRAPAVGGHLGLLARR